MSTTAVLFSRVYWSHFCNDYYK